MELSPGLKVRVKSFDWYNANKHGDGTVHIKVNFVSSMSRHCGKIVTIENVYDDSFSIVEDVGYRWCKEFVEPLDRPEPPEVREEGDSLVLSFNDQEMVVDKKFALDLSVKIAEKLC